MSRRCLVARNVPRCEIFLAKSSPHFLYVLGCSRKDLFHETEVPRCLIYGADVDVIKYILDAIAVP